MTDFATWWWPYLVGLLTGWGAPRLLAWMDARAQRWEADDDCRFAADPSHVCRRRDGRPVRPGVEVCWTEARTQVREGR